MSTVDPKVTIRVCVYRGRTAEVDALSISVLTAPRPQNTSKMAACMFIRVPTTRNYVYYPMCLTGSCNDARNATTPLNTLYII